MKLRGRPKSVKPRMMKTRLPIQLSETAIAGLDAIASEREMTKPGIAAMLIEEASRTKPEDFAQVLAAISKFRAK